MCILCDMQRMAAATNHGTVALAEGLQAVSGVMVKLVDAIEGAKRRGVTLDSEIQTAYDDAVSFLRGEGSEQEATGDGSGQPLPEGMADRIAEAVSEKTGIPKDRIIFCDSPEQAEAIIQRMSDPDKKTH